MTQAFLLFVAVGLVGAVALVVSARLSGFDRDRSFYPTVLCTIALLYVLFGVQAGGATVIAVETAVAFVFVAAAVVAHRRGSAALLAAGLAAHGLWDLVHGHVLPASGAVPPWWGPFCLGVDVALAAFVALRWPPYHPTPTPDS